MMVPSSSLATWPPTNTKPPALVATERGSVRVPGLRSAKYSIVIVGASANNHAAGSSTPPALASPAVLPAMLRPSSRRAPFHLGPLVARLRPSLSDPYRLLV